MGYASLAEPILEQGIAHLDALESAGHGGRAARAFALLEMGWQMLDLDRARARHCFEQSLDLYQALDDRWGRADALYALGWLIDGLGDYDGGDECWTRAWPYDRLWATDKVRRTRSHSLG